MGEIIFRDPDKSRSARKLARQYLPGMVDSRQVCLALRQLISEAKLSAEEFADEAGVARATVYRIEGADKKKYSPRTETISALVESRGLTITAFFARIEGLPTPVAAGHNAPAIPASTGATAHDHSVPSASAISDKAVVLAVGDTIADAVDRGFARVEAFLIGQQAAAPRVAASKRAPRNRASRR